MSYAASLPEPQRAIARAAFAAFGQLLNEALDDQAATAQAYGPRAVAEAAHVPGGPPAEEIEAAYLRLAAESRRHGSPGTGKAA